MAELMDVRKHNEDNLFKALEMSIFAKIAEPGDEDLVTIFDEDGIVVPEGYEDVGLTTKDDGATWTSAVDTSEDPSHGYLEPSRTDITSDVSGLSFTAREAKRIVMELFYGQKIQMQDAGNGGGFWDKTTRPVRQRVRLLGIAQDGEGSNQVVCARWLPSSMLSDRSDQEWSDSASSTYPLSFNAHRDPRFGVAFRELWGGPGWDPQARGFELLGGSDGGAGDDSGADEGGQ